MMTRTIDGDDRGMKIDEAPLPRKGSDRPRFLPGQLIEVRAYNGKPRSEKAEVYKAAWNYDRQDWCLSVRLIVGEGEKPQFRNFYQQMLEAEQCPTVPAPTPS